MTERVGETCLKEVGELGTFFISETCVEMVGFGILDVNFLMCHIHVTTNKHGFLCVKFLQIETESVIPRHALVKALEPILGIRCIDGDDEEFLIFEGDDAPFGVHVEPPVVGHGRNDFIGQSEGDREGCVLGVDGCAGIAFLFGIVPIGLITRKGEVKLSLLHLGLLQAKEIRVERGEDFGKAFTTHGAESVYIPRNKLHGVLCEFAEIHLVHVALLDEGVVECMGGSEVMP